MRRHRCEKHDLLWDSEHRCQGCRADALQEQLDKAKDQLLTLTGELKVHVGIGYPVRRIVDPILFALGFRHVPYLMGSEQKAVMKLGQSGFDGYWLLPTSLAEKLQEIYNKIQDELNSMTKHTIQHVFAVTEHVFQEKIEEFISAKLLSKELQAELFKERK